MGRPTRTAVVLFIITIIYVTVGWYGSEVHSCKRSNSSRASIAHAASAARDVRARAAKRDLSRGDRGAYRLDHEASMLYGRVVRNTRPLDCSGPTPNTQ